MSIEKKELLKILSTHPEYKDELTDEVNNNLDKLLVAVNKVREAYGKPMVVTSGWRPESYNKSVKGATKSAHIMGMAVDFRDSDGALDAFCVELDKQGKLKEWGLWLEHPDATAGWCHLDIKPRGNRKTNIFKP